MLKKDYFIQAEKIFEKEKNLYDIVIAIRNYLGKHFSNKKISYKAHSIIESRFTPPEISFKIGMRSCGSITNIVAEMLRHMGYEVRKVHGTTPQSPDHSWIKVRNLGIDKWESYDITQKSCRVSKEHTEIAECNEWIEIADVIVKAHLDFVKKKPKIQRR